MVTYIRFDAMVNWKRAGDSGQKTNPSCQRKARGLPHPSAPKTGPVLTGRNADAAHEGTTKNLSRSKPAGGCNLFKGHRCRFNLAARGFEAEVLDVSGGSFARLLLKLAGEVSRTHGRTPGKATDGEVAPEVVGKPGEQITEGPARRGLRHESGAELRLTARPAQKHHHHLSDLESDGPAQVFLHKCESEVDSGGYTRGGVAVSVPNKDGAGVHGHARVVAGKLFAPVPVGGGAAAIEKAGLRQDQRAGADRTKAPAARASLFKPVEKLPLVTDLGNAVVPGDEKRIDGTTALGVGSIRANGKTEMTQNIAIGAGRDETDFVCWSVAPGAVGIAEYLQRSEHIERPHRRHSDDENTACASPRRAVVSLSTLRGKSPGIRLIHRPNGPDFSFTSCATSGSRQKCGAVSIVSV